MLRCEQYLVHCGTFSIHHASLERARDDKEAIADEDVGFVEVPEGHHRKLIAFLACFGPEHVRFAFLDVSVVLILNTKQFVHLSIETLLRV